MGIPHGRATIIPTMGAASHDTFTPLMPPRLLAYLMRCIWYRRFMEAGQLLGYGIAAIAAWFIASALLDRLFGLGERTRLCLLAGDVFLFLWIVLGLLRCIFRPLNLHAAAAAVEPNFNYRLESIVSCWSKPQHANSSIFASELWRSVKADLASHPPTSGIPWQLLFYPWVAVALICVAIGALWHIPTLRMDRLGLRLIHPYALIPPVTTTILTVGPGNADVIEQSLLAIHANVQRLGESIPIIHFSTDSLAFAKAPMSLSSDGFVWNVPALEKDLTYFITGGDARTPLYHITVLQRPALSQLRVRYDYPTYTHHDALRVTTSTGPVEAPQGTHVGVDIISITPLSSATLQIGSQTLSSSPTASQQIRHLELTLDHDFIGRLHLIGSNKIPCREDIPIEFIAVADQPPLVQLLEPAADIHLTPRDLLTISWQALDDFGIEKLLLQWQINNEPPRQIPLPINGDPRRCIGAVDIDLANMPLKISDLLTLSVIAFDGNNHETRTPPRQISISPRAVDIDSYLRLSALERAADLSSQLTGNLQLSLATWSNANQLNQNLASAADASSALQLTLLQAVQHTADNQTVLAISQIADCVAVISAAIEQTQLNNEHGERITAAEKSAREIQAELSVMARGERAAMVLADRANVREISLSPQKDPQLRLRLEETLARANEEAVQGARNLGISDKAADVEAQLNLRVHLGEQLVGSMRPIDLLKAAQQWAHAMADPDNAPRDLARRLEVAAELESVRVGGQPVRARDLRLAGRAANRIEETALHDPIISKPVLAKMIADYPAALGAMFGANGSPAARAQMKLWAAEPDLLASAADVLNQPQAQDLAMEANARMAQHDYAGAAALDAKLVDLPEAQQTRQNIVAAARQMRTAERVDQVTAQQQSLAAQTTNAAHSSVLARDQEQVAQNIEQVRQQSSDGVATGQNSRDDAMAAITRAQQQLAQMPAALADGQFTQQIHRAENLAADLDRFNPETSATVNSLRNSLIPALQKMQQPNPQRSAGITPANAARASIAQIQSLLSQTQQRLADQDPFVAAKWAAEAAASALQREPPDLTAAHRQQNKVAQALENAYMALIRQAALERLAGSQTISPPLAAPAPAGWQTAPATPNMNSTDTEPVGYAAALRAYFQKLSDNRDGP